MSRATTILFILTICVAIVICLSIRTCCGPHQISVECRNTCAVTCDTYPYSPRFCPRICIKGCDCVKGYIYNDNNTCVLPEEC